MSCFVLLQKPILDIKKFARGGRIQEENERRSEERSIKITIAHNFFFFSFLILRMWEPILTSQIIFLKSLVSFQANRYSCLLTDDCSGVFPFPALDSLLEKELAIERAHYPLSECQLYLCHL